MRMTGSSRTAVGWLVGGLALLAADADALAKPARFMVYVGTYTGGKSKGIYAFRFDAKDGQAEAPALVAPTPNPTFLALHPNGQCLYAANEIGNFQGQKAGAISAFAIDRTDGSLRLLNQVSSGGSGPCHLIVDPTGKWVLVANYGGGSVAVLATQADGSLGESVSFHQHSGSSMNPQRQEGPHAHGVTLDSAGRFLFVPDLGLDKLMAYRLDPASGKLTPNDPPFVRLKPGSGPRHFTFSPDGRFGYAINELASTVTAFAYDRQRGTLQELQSVSTLPDGFAGKSTTAEIEVHPNGRFLYGSNRGFDTIAGFAIERASGKLRPVAQVSTEGKTPRNFAIDPTGEWLWAANQDSDSLALFRIDPKRGLLLPAGKSFELGAPVCVKFLPLP